jgi:hypothetical protein
MGVTQKHYESTKLLMSFTVKGSLMTNSRFKALWLDCVRDPFIEADRMVSIL